MQTLIPAPDKSYQQHTRYTFFNRKRLPVMGCRLVCLLAFFMLGGLIFIEAIPDFIQSTYTPFENIWGWKFWISLSIISTLLFTAGREIMHAGLFFWKPARSVVVFLDFMRSALLFGYLGIFIYTILHFYEVLNKLSLSQWGWQGCILFLTSSIFECLLTSLYLHITFESNKEK